MGSGFALINELLALTPGFMGRLVKKPFGGA